MSQPFARVAVLLVLPASLAACRSAGEAEASVPAVPPASTAPAAVIAPRPWEHERSDVPVDPRIHFGALDNGLRFAWAENPEPNDRGYLRLHVDAGSLAEEDDELGMAHFLEHMAFDHALLLRSPQQPVQGIHLGRLRRQRQQFRNARGLRSRLRASRRYLHPLHPKGLLLTGLRPVPAQGRCQWPALPQ
jgi:hypothetical protein